MKENVENIPFKSENVSIEMPVDKKKEKVVPLVKWALILLAIFGLIFFGREAGRYVFQFAQWVEEQGVWAPLIYIAGYIFASIAFIPGSVLTLAAGAIFGIFKGTLYVFMGSTLGSTAAFLISRYGARRFIERKLVGNPRFSAIDRAIGVQGRKIIFLLRLSPVFPFNLLNYALGLTRIRLLDYVLGSMGMIPGTLLYVYYGKLIGDIATLASGASVEKGTGYYVVLGLGLGATFAVTTVITRIARRALKEATDVSPK